MSDLKHLKFTQSGFETYTGPIGMYEFVDGVSTEAITRADRDRLATAFQFAEVDGDGGEHEAGVAARLVADSATRMPTTNLERQTDEDKEAEGRRAQLMAAKPEVELMTRAQLEELARKHGIKGLRSEVADKWGVRNRSIPLLIDEILVAQNNWISTRNEQANLATKVEAPVEPVEPVAADEGLTDEQLAAAAEGTVLTEDAAGDEALAAELGKDQLTAAELAAASGDMGAALNQLQNPEGANEEGAVAADPDAAAVVADHAEPGADAAEAAASAADAGKDA